MFGNGRKGGGNDGLLNVDVSERLAIDLGKLTISRAARKTAICVISAFATRHYAAAVYVHKVQT